MVITGDDEREATEEDLFAASFERERARMTRVAFLLTGSTTAADDAVAAAAERVLAAVRRGGVADAVGYLRTAVVNEVRAEHRSRAARLQRESRVGDGLPPSLDLDRRLDILRALRALGDRQRAVVVLRYYADLTEVETAATLGITVGTVKSQAARALRRLRPLLEEVNE